MRSRNLLLLVVSQALGMCAPPIVILIGGILGTQLAPSPTWSTLPVSLMVVGLAIMTIPAALIMRRIGRQKGFIIGTLIASFGAFVAILAIVRADFLLFCLSALLIGMNSAFVQQYRFAASESVTPQYSARAISLVLVGGIAAGFLGPEIAKRTKELLPLGEYTGTFLVLIGIYLIIIVLLSFLRDLKITDTDEDGEERPLRQVALQPKFLTALMAGIVSYGVMTFVMTATPVYMNRMQDYSLDQTVLVIQSHIIAMYLPSLFSGFLFERFGLTNVMLAGAFSMLITAALGIYSHAFMHLWWALVLLGIGWNFLFVGGTLLLTASYRPSERFKSQALNDFSIFSVQALASLNAGTVLFNSSWDILNFLTIPLLLATMGMLVYLRAKKKI